MYFCLHVTFLSCFYQLHFQDFFWVLYKNKGFNQRDPYFEAGVMFLLHPLRENLHLFLFVLPAIQCFGECARAVIVIQSELSEFPRWCDHIPTQNLFTPLR